MTELWCFDGFVVLSRRLWILPPLATFYNVREQKGDCLSCYHSSSTSGYARGPISQGSCHQECILTLHWMQKDGSLCGLCTVSKVVAWIVHC